MEENTNEVNESTIESMDDLDALLNGDTDTKKVSTTKVEEPKQEPVIEEKVIEEPKKPIAQEPKADDGMKKLNETMAAMRVKIKESDDLFTKLANAKGMSVEALKESLSKDATKEAAAQLNVTPEVYDRLTKLEAENKAQKEELEALKDKDAKEQQARLLTQNIEQVQKEQGLSDDQVREFVQETINQGINVLDGRVPLNILYKGMHFDKLVEEQIEKAKQELIKQYDKADKYAAGTVKDSGHVDNSAGGITTLADLNALLDK